VTGHPGGGPITVTDDPVRYRLVLSVGDGKAHLAYRREGALLHLVHTEVPWVLRGGGAGGRLVAAAVGLARRQHLVMVPWCPFARRWLDRHPEERRGVEVDWERGA
jgi:uncharacterized protein